MVKCSSDTMGVGVLGIKCIIAAGGYGVGQVPEAVVNVATPERLIP
jgi:hypothetical protein